MHFSVCSEDIVAAKKNFQKQQMSNDEDSDDAEYFSNNDREGSVSSEENLPRKRRVPVAKGTIFQIIIAFFYQICYEIQLLLVYCIKKF